MVVAGYGCLETSYCRHFYVGRHYRMRLSGSVATESIWHTVYIQMLERYKTMNRSKQVSLIVIRVFIVIGERAQVRVR